MKASSTLSWDAVLDFSFNDADPAQLRGYLVQLDALVLGCERFILVARCLRQCHIDRAMTIVTVSTLVSHSVAQIAQLDDALRDTRDVLQVLYTMEITAEDTLSAHPDTRKRTAEDLSRQPEARLISHQDSIQRRRKQSRSLGQIRRAQRGD